MKDLKKVLAMVDNFLKIISKAQTTSAQSGDIERVLKSANLFDISQKVAPLLNDAKVPDNASVQIDIIVDKHLNPNYLVVLNPPSSADKKLEILIKKNFASQMKKALVDAKLNVTDDVITKWLTF